MFCSGLAHLFAMIVLLYAPPQRREFPGVFSTRVIVVIEQLECRTGTRRTISSAPLANQRGWEPIPNGTVLALE